MNTMTMEKQETLTATVTIAYVNPPWAEGKPASIKDSEGQKYSIWTPGLLEQFQPGETCYIDYRFKNGFKTVVARRPVVQEPRPQLQQQQQRSAPVQQHVTPPNGNGNGNYYRPTSPKDARRMFLCSQLNALITSRQVALTADGIADAIRMLSEAYDATIGAEDVAS